MSSMHSFAMSTFALLMPAMRRGVRRRTTWGPTFAAGISLTRYFRPMLPNNRIYESFARGATARTFYAPDNPTPVLFSADDTIAHRVCHFLDAVFVDLRDQLLDAATR